MRHGLTICATFLLLPVVTITAAPRVDLLSVEQDTGNVHLRWASQPGQVFRVECRTTLQPAFTWQTLATNVPAGTVTETEFIHSNALVWLWGFIGLR